MEIDNLGSKTMQTQNGDELLKEEAIWHQDTPQEKILMDLLGKRKETLSKIACTYLEVAIEDSQNCNLFPNIYYDPNEGEEAMKLMALLARGITWQERKTLTEIADAANLAALSIDPDSKTFVVYKIGVHRLYDYYRDLCGMLNTPLQDISPE